MGEETVTVIRVERLETDDIEAIIIDFRRAGELLELATV